MRLWAETYQWNDGGGKMQNLWKRIGIPQFRHGKRTPRVPVASKFEHFRAIGAANDVFLHSLSALLEGLDRSSVSLGMAASATEGLKAQIASMVESLASLAGGGYEGLLQRYQELSRQIDLQVQNLRRVENGPVENGPVETGPFIVWPRDGSALLPRVVGPKAARLAEVALQTALQVPSFFSVSIHGYRLFMQASGMQEYVDGLLWSTDLRDPVQMKRFCDDVGMAFADAPFPPALEDAISRAFDSLVASSPGATGVAIRSSAVVEDAGSSFAGQFDSVLNVDRAGLAAAYKHVVASKYHPQVMRYALARGFFDEDIAMPVLAMAMVQPSASGVAYSRCPERPDSALISAVPGLAQAMVDGRVVPDTYLVSPTTPPRVEPLSLGSRAFMLRCAAGGGLEEVADGPSRTKAPALMEDTASRIASAARELEHHFGFPQDVEWATDETGSLLVVQTRPLNVSPTRAAPRIVPPNIEGYRILVRGAARASGGTASGPVFNLDDVQAVDAVPEGVILCVPTTSPRLAGIMTLVRGIMAAAGSPTGHMATIAREFNVPCLIGAGITPSIFHSGTVVTLDADAGIVYEGEVPELLSSTARTAAPSRQRASLREKVQPLLDRLAPLTLTGQPGSSGFDPGKCRTLHDIARYVHQQSMTDMFQLEEVLSPLDKRTAHRLAWRAPMEVRLLDVGNGFDHDANATVPVDRVRSIPLLALLEGMSDPRLRWAGPVGFDFRGFMSVVVRSAADDQRYGEPTYCICAHDYVHFATRLAYHFATVDSICGRSINENYVRFLFFGGAAIASRREWRAHFLSAVLRSNGFNVRQVGDRVEAMLVKRGAEQIEEALVMLGRLMVASRQLDMVIESQAAANALAQAFVSGDYGFERVSSTGN